jgi:hypothetical protein
VSWLSRLFTAQVQPPPASLTWVPKPGLASTLIQGRAGAAVRSRRTGTHPHAGDRWQTRACDAAWVRQASTGAAATGTAWSTVLALCARSFVQVGPGLAGGGPAERPSASNCSRASVLQRAQSRRRSGLRRAAGTAGAGVHRRGRPGVGVVRSRSATSIALQRHFVGRGFAVHHHQVAGHAAPGPQRSAWLSDRSRPRPGRAAADTSSSGRSPEMPKRHSSRRSHHRRCVGAPGTGLRPRQREHQRRGQRLHGGQVPAPMRSARRRTPASVADISTRVRRGWPGGTCRSPPAAWRRSLAAVAKVSRAWPPAGDAQPHRQHAHRVQPGVQSRRGAAAACSRTSGISACGGWVPGCGRSQCWRSVWQRSQHRGRFRPGSAPCAARFGGQARLARSNSRACCGACHAPLHEQVAECRVRLVGAGSASVGSKAEMSSIFERLVARVVEFHLGGTRCRPRADPHRGAHVQVRPAGVEAHAVGVEDAAVHGLRIGRRVLVSRHQPRRPGRRKTGSCPGRRAARRRASVSAHACPAAAPAPLAAAPRCSGRWTAGAWAPAACARQHARCSRGGAALRLRRRFGRPAARAGAIPRAAPARAAAKPRPRCGVGHAPAARRAASSTLASATMLMPWWWAMKVCTRTSASLPVCRAGVKSSASMKP